MHDFPLPDALTGLVTARNFLRQHYESVNLKFQFDGNLVGDIGEAVAAELYGIKLLPAGGTGIDGIAPDGRSVQVKATGTGRGPAFRHVEKRADVLLFFAFDFEQLKGTVVFNGPEVIALKRLPASWIGQRSLTAQQIVAADRDVPAHERLPLLSKPPQA